jgi:hypothetical protein
MEQRTRQPGLFHGIRPRLPGEIQRLAARLLGNGSSDRSHQCLVRLRGDGSDWREQRRKKRPGRNRGTGLGHSTGKGIPRRIDLDRKRQGEAPLYDLLPGHAQPSDRSATPAHSHGTSWVDRLPRGQSSSHVLVLNACSDLLAARVWETGKSRDVDGLRNALQDAEKLISRIVGHDQATLIELLCARGEMSKIARQAQTAAIECGNPDVAERFGTLRSALDERKKRLEAPTASNEWIRAQAGKVEAMLLSTPADMVENSPRLTPEDLLPGRLRDQSFYSALYSLASWLLLAVGMLLTFVYRFRGPALYRRLSKRLGSLLQFSDWAWILGGGILLPFLLWLAAVLLTPIGGRNATHPGHFLATPLLNLELLIGLFFVSPILFVRWRLGLRGNVLGFRKYTPWGWFSVFYLSALIAGISILPNPAGSVCGCGHVDWRELFPWRTLTFISLFPPIAWLGVTSGRALFSAASRLPHRMTAARALVTAYALGMLCLLGTAFGFLASYKRWSDQNPLLILSAEKPSLTPYDYQVTRQLQTELRALWK